MARVLNRICKIICVTMLVGCCIVAFIFFTSNNNKEEKDDTTKNLSLKTTNENVFKNNPDINITNDIEEKKVDEPILDQEENSEIQSPFYEGIVYTEEDLYYMSRVIYCESRDCDDEFQQSVGAVVMNRVDSSYFPNTVKEVIFQDGQYACTWLKDFENVVPDEQSLINAENVLGRPLGYYLPINVVFQAEFTQGSGTFKQIGNTYFCYQ